MSVKITGLSANTTMATTDLLTIVANVGTTPVNKKITFANFKTALNIPSGLSWGDSISGSTGDGLTLTNSGSGKGLYINLTGGGYAGYFETSNGHSVLSKSTSSNGHAFYALCTTGGDPFHSDQQNITSTNFRKHFWLNSVQLWTSDGTDPNGNLSGTAGDFCLKGVGNAPAFCTGTTNWTTLGAGGGSAITIFDATVGPTGADYTTVKGALDDGKTSILIIGNTTETADFSSTGCYIYISRDCTWDLAQKLFTTNTAGKLTIDGQGTLAYSNSTSGTQYKIEATSSGTIVVRNIFVSSSSVDTTFFIKGSQIVENITFTLSNAFGGFWCSGALNQFNNIEVVGGGNACAFAFNINAGDTQIENVKISGSWNTGSYPVYTSGGTINANNITVNSSSDVPFAIHGHWSNIKSTTNKIIIESTGEVHLKNISTKGGNVTLNIAKSTIDGFNTNYGGNGSIIPGSSSVKVSNGYTNYCTINGTAIHVVNVESENGFNLSTYSPTGTMISNCTGYGVNISGDDNIVTGCYNTGGITINAGADRNIITGNSVSSAGITDNGTSTVLTGNVTRP